MSLTSYRAAPPRVNFLDLGRDLTEILRITLSLVNEANWRCDRQYLYLRFLERIDGGFLCGKAAVLISCKRNVCPWQAWQRPTLPGLET
jgi:hypothetical protein